MKEHQSPSLLLLHTTTMDTLLLPAAAAAAARSPLYVPRSAPAGLTSRRRNLTGRVRPPDSRHSQGREKGCARKKCYVSIPKYSSVCGEIDQARTGTHVAYYQGRRKGVEGQGDSKGSELIGVHEDQKTFQHIDLLAHTTVRIIGNKLVCPNNSHS